MLSYAVLVLVTALPFLVTAHCPVHCECDDRLMLVNCTSFDEELSPRRDLDIPNMDPLSVIPISLNPMLETLHLRRNAIKSIDVSALQFYGKLIFVDFSHNDISGALPPRCFGAQRRLRDLRLDFNRITNVTKETFAGLTELRSLSLSHNRLVNLTQNVFVHLIKVGASLKLTFTFSSQSRFKKPKWILILDSFDLMNQRASTEFIRYILTLVHCTVDIG